MEHQEAQEQQQQPEVQQNQVELDQQQQDAQPQQQERQAKNYNNKYGNKNHNNYRGKKYKGGYGYQNQYNKYQQNVMNVYFQQLMAYFGTKSYLQRDKNYRFKNEFPRAKNYKSIESIAEAFPDLKNVNSESFDVESIQDARCFVMRSNNDDDIHKAIKYGVWTSTQNNNTLLSTAYKESKEKNIDIYFIFSVVKSGQFLGIAKLVSEYQDKNFEYWFQCNKFLGQFKIEWVFVKDIVYKKFENIKNQEGLSIIRSKDCTEIDFATAGKQVFQIFKEQSNEPNIFGEFDFMDKREDLLRNFLLYQKNWAKSFYQQQYYQNEMQQYYYNQPYQQGGVSSYGHPQYGQQYYMSNKQNGAQYMGAQNGYYNQQYQYYIQNNYSQQQPYMQQNQAHYQQQQLQQQAQNQKNSQDETSENQENQEQQQQQQEVLTTQ